MDSFRGCRSKFVFSGGRIAVFVLSILAMSIAVALPSTILFAQDERVHPVDKPRIVGYSEEGPVAMIYTTDRRPERRDLEGVRESLRPHIVVAIWGDGQLVWSQNEVLGAPPYLKAKIDPVKVVQMVESIQEKGYLSHPSLHSYYLRANHPPKSQLILRSPERAVALQSSHEIDELNPNIVGVKGNRIALNEVGLSREEVLAREPPEYRHFREVWDEIRSHMITLTEGIDGDPLEDSGIVWERWRLKANWAGDQR